jgi:hypothetical protein
MASETRLALRMGHPAKRPAMGRKRSSERTRAAAIRAAGTKSEYSEEVFGEVVRHAERSGGPMDADHVATEGDPLAEAVALDFESQAEIFEDFEAQRFEATDGLVDAGADEVEPADTDGIVFGGGVGNFPGSEGEHGETSKDGCHQPLAWGFKDEGERKGDVVCLGFVGEAEGALESVGAEENVAVGEEQPFGCGLAGSESHGVGLAHPAFGEGVDVDDGEEFSGGQGFCSEAGGHGIHDRASGVRGAVVDSDDFDRNGLIEEGTERGFDGSGFVAGGDDNGDLRSGLIWGGGFSRVVAGVEEIRNAGQMIERRQDDSSPDEGDEPGQEDDDNVEGVHGKF